MDQKRKPDIEGRALQYPGFERGGARAVGSSSSVRASRTGKAKAVSFPPRFSRSRLRRPVSAPGGRARSSLSCRNSSRRPARSPNTPGSSACSRLSTKESHSSLRRPAKTPGGRSASRFPARFSTSRLERSEKARGGERPQAVVLEREPFQAGERAQVGRAQCAEDGAGSGLETRLLRPDPERAEFGQRPASGSCAVVGPEPRTMARARRPSGRKRPPG